MVHFSDNSKKQGCFYVGVGEGNYWSVSVAFISHLQGGKSSKCTEHYNYGISTLTTATIGHVSQRASKPTRNLPSHQKAVKNK